MRSAASPINRSRSSPMAASAVSTASSPSFLAQRGYALVEAMRSIGDVGVGLGARLDALFEVMEGEVRHPFRSAFCISSLPPEANRACSACAELTCDPREAGHRFTFPRMGLVGA